MTIKDAVAAGSRSENWLISIGFAVPVYVTDADIPIVYDNHRWLPTDISAVSIPLEDAGGSCKVVIRDTGKLDKTEVDQDAAGLLMTVSKIYNRDPLLVSLEWSGMIEDWQTVDRQQVSISGVGWGLLKTGPGLPVLTDSCVHAFRGTGCGYAGVETECDGTLARCIVLGNQLRHVSAYWAPIAGDVVWIQGQRYTVPAGGTSYPNSVPGGSGQTGGGLVDDYIPVPPPATS